MDILKYKGYEGTAELDMARCVCRGKILFIDDVVSFEAAAPAALQKEFEEAVDDYIETCAALGRPAKLPLKGQFNVRVPPALHRATALRAMKENVSLNDVVVRALDAFVCIHVPINHNVRVTIDMPGSSINTLVSSASSQPAWSTHNVH
jgi:predicted HicB family RNase H-like nuclease